MRLRSVDVGEAPDAGRLDLDGVLNMVRRVAVGGLFEKGGTEDCALNDVGWLGVPTKSPRGNSAPWSHQIKSGDVLRTLLSRWIRVNYE